MKTLSRLKSGFTNCKTGLKNNYGKYLAKTVAVGALGMIGYDAHIVGLLQSDSYSKTRDAEACIKAATNTMYLSQPSTIQSEMKKGVFRLEEQQNWRSFINSTIGYFKGIGISMVSNVVPLGLGLMTILASKKPIVKTGGWLLGAYGAFSMMKDVLGFGQPKDLNRRF